MTAITVQSPYCMQEFGLRSLLPCLQAILQRQQQGLAVFRERKQQMRMTS